MHLFLLAPLVWLYVASRIRAALTNRTIDDAGPLTRYIPMVDGLCIGCTSGDQLDPAQLYNGTVTTYGLQNVDLTAAIEMNFTGTAIYIFMAAPAEQASQQCRFALDGASTGGLFTSTVSSTGPQYNVLAYANDSLPDGEHTFQIKLAGLGAFVNFDYAVHTFGDPDPTSSSSSTSTSSTSTTPHTFTHNMVASL
ncbi:hypothetical protein B0H14DRAFT_3531763 [Mycena olivaceomarginata]|nr:hypothetical protein B0H14DRAFT_3531763 [Mycena olivaceomarginata]